MQAFDTVNEVIRRSAAGLPVAVFHKIADPRPEANLKEYYVTPDVYRRWVDGLASARFHTVNSVDWFVPQFRCRPGEPDNS
jgi:hypothetical protein